MGSNWNAIWIALGAAVFVGVAGGVATRIGPWYYNLQKPSWQPPDWLFGPAWTLIFLMSAASGVLAWRAAPTEAQQTLVIVLFAINGALNILWSVLFFTMRRPDWALNEVVALWFSILAPILVFLPFSWPASALLMPYLLWVTFAAYLNLTIVRLNAPFAPA